jgi:hypothetical protein
MSKNFFDPALQKTVIGIWDPSGRGKYPFMRLLEGNIRQFVHRHLQVRLVEQGRIKPEKLYGLQMHPMAQIDSWKMERRYKSNQFVRDFNERESINHHDHTIIFHEPYTQAEILKCQDIVKPFGFSDVIVVFIDPHRIYDPDSVDDVEHNEKSEKSDAYGQSHLIDLSKYVEKSRFFRSEKTKRHVPAGQRSYNRISTENCISELKCFIDQYAGTSTQIVFCFLFLETEDNGDKQKPTYEMIEVKFGQFLFSTLRSKIEGKEPLMFGMNNEGLSILSWKSGLARLKPTDDPLTRFFFELIEHKEKQRIVHSASNRFVECLLGTKNNLKKYVSYLERD